MRIKEIHIYQKDLPVVGGPYTMSTMILDNLDTTIIKIVSDTGLVGWGEVTPLGPLYQPQHAKGARAAIAELAPSLIGQNCLFPLMVMRKMNNLLNGHHYAKAGIEIALMDLLGKHYDLRVCDLLGGSEVQQVPAHYAIGIGTPDEVARTAKDKMDQGFKLIQLKAGGRDIAIDIEVVNKVWETVGNGVKFAVDPNRGMTAADAKVLSLACRDIPFTLEQPCKTIEELVSIRSQIVHPIKLDENLESLNDVLRAISLNVCDKFGLKITRVGGLHTMATIRDICETRSIPQTCEDSWGGDIIASATVQMGATVQPRLLEAVWTASDYIEEHYDPENGIEIKNGHFTVPSRPGLGINPEADRIGRLITTYS